MRSWSRNISQRFAQTFWFDPGDKLSRVKVSIFRWQVLQLLYHIVQHSQRLRRWQQVLIPVRVFLVIQLLIQIFPEQVDGEAEAVGRHVVKPKCGNEKNVARFNVDNVSFWRDKFRKRLDVWCVNVDDLRFVAVQVKVQRLVWGPHHGSFATDNLTIVKMDKMSLNSI